DITAEESSDSSSNTSGSLPSSPRGGSASLNSSVDETAPVETFAAWDSVPTPEHLLNWRNTPPQAEQAPPLIAITDGGMWRLENGADAMWRQDRLLTPLRRVSVERREGAVVAHHAQLQLCRGGAPLLRRGHVATRCARCLFSLSPMTHMRRAEH